MNPKVSVFIATSLAAVLVFLSTSQPTSAREINLETLLTEMIDRSEIAEFPNPAFACKQCSSYNRATVEVGKPGGFANADSSFFYGHEDVDGRREWIMMDVEGKTAELAGGESVVQTVHGAGAISSLSVKLDMERLHWQKTAKLDYAVTTHWYAMDGAVGNGETTPAKVLVKIGNHAKK